MSGFAEQLLAFDVGLLGNWALPISLIIESSSLLLSEFLVIKTPPPW